MHEGLSEINIYSHFYEPKRTIFKPSCFIWFHHHLLLATWIQADSWNTGKILTSVTAFAVLLPNRKRTCTGPISSVFFAVWRELPSWGMGICNILLHYVAAVSWTKGEKVSRVPRYTSSPISLQLLHIFLKYPIMSLQSDYISLSHVYIYQRNVTILTDEQHSKQIHRAIERAREGETERVRKGEKEWKWWRERE